MTVARPASIRAPYSQTVRIRPGGAYRVSDESEDGEDYEDYEDYEGYGRQERREDSIDPSKRAPTCVFTAVCQPGVVTSNQDNRALRRSHVS